MNIQQEPLYRRDLDIVAIAPDGEVAAFCTFWYDDVTRSAYIEPVGTRPAHQKKGLGKAVITEGLRRLKAMGGLAASVHGFSVPANKLYNAAVSPDCILASTLAQDLGTKRINLVPIQTKYEEYEKAVSCFSHVEERSCKL